ncbi:MAG: TylF/MycF/NovP-related O-methyltransferase [Oscillospiraceae bacterium]
MERIVIWGCGQYGKNLYRSLSTGYECSIIGFIDTNITGTYMGIPIYKPENLLNLNADRIIIAMHNKEWRKEIISQIKSMNISGECVEVFDYPYGFSTHYYSRVNWLENFASQILENNIAGSVAEAGVFRGVFAKWINCFFPERKLYLFDTFEGFSECDIKTEIVEVTENFGESIYANERNFDLTSEEIVLNSMLFPENVIVKKGYFPDSSVGINDNFCFVNLDMDLYLPILNGLRFFCPKMVSGGVILIHDYYNNNLPGVKKAVQQYETDTMIKLNTIPIGDGLSIAVLF